MPDKEDVVGHSLDFVDHGTETVDNVEVAFPTSARITIMEFVLAAKSARNQFM